MDEQSVLEARRIALSLPPLTQAQRDRLTRTLRAPAPTPRKALSA